MKVLIACEFSGIVRDAFIAEGHEAYSVDLLPTERPGPHYQCDVFKLNLPYYDLMVAFPPCTYLANSGVRWLYGGKGIIKDKVRWEQMEHGAAFFDALLHVDIPKIAVENPIMHSHAKKLINGLPTQIIQPWQFGHGEIKATQLWLKNLQPLVPTNIVDGRSPRVHWASPSPNRWAERSRTLPGIAEAMAKQWGQS